MDKKYIENAKKNIDIWIYSAVIGFIAVIGICYILDKYFDLILYEKYQIVLGMVVFIISFNGLKKARKNNEPNDLLDNIDEIKDGIKSATSSTKNFMHKCTTNKTENEDSTFLSTEESIEKSTEESISEDEDSKEITLPVYLADEEKNEKPDEFDIDTPLKGFIVCGGFAAIVFAIVYSIAALICWSYPTDTALGIAVIISAIVGALGAIGSK